MASRTSNPEGGDGGEDVAMGHSYTNLLYHIVFATRAFTVRDSQVEKVRPYIANQEIHHRKRNFDEDFAALLRAHGISPDPNHL